MAFETVSTLELQYVAGGVAWQQVGKDALNAAKTGHIVGGVGGAVIGGVAGASAGGIGALPGAWLGWRIGGAVGAIGGGLWGAGRAIYRTWDQ